MLSNRTNAALFAIAIASSLLVVSSGGLVGTVFAKKAKSAVSTAEDDASLPAVLRPDSSNSDPQKTPSADTGDSLSGSTGGDTSSISPKDLKSLSNCESDAAADGDLTQAEVTDCYLQVF
jgi:hypothetical protein